VDYAATDLRQGDVSSGRRIFETQTEEEVVELGAGGGLIGECGGLGSEFEGGVEAGEFFLVEGEFGFGERGFFTGGGFAVN